MAAGLSMEKEEDMEVLRMAYMESLDADEIKLELPTYNESKMDVDIYNRYFGWDISEVGLYKALREDLKNVPYLEVMNVSDDEEVCELYIYVYSGKQLDMYIPISKNTPRAYEYIIENATFDDYMVEENITYINMITDESSRASGAVEVYGYWYLNNDKVEVNTHGTATIDEEEDLKHLAELMERFQEEEGDTLFVFSGEIYFYINTIDSEGWSDYQFSKRIPKDLADEFMELFAKYTY